MAYLYILTDDETTTDELYVGNLLPDLDKHREDYIAVHTKSQGTATNNNSTLEMCIPVVGKEDQWSKVVNYAKGDLKFARAVHGAKIRVRKTTLSSSVVNATQTVTVPANRFFAGSHMVWEPVAASRPEITVAGLKPNTDKLYFGRLLMEPTGQLAPGRCNLWLTDKRTGGYNSANGDDFSDAWETGGTLTVTTAGAAGETITVNAPGASDRQEPYLWTPTNSADVAAFAARQAARGNGAAITTIKFEIATVTDSDPLEVRISGK